MHSDFIENVLFMPPRETHQGRGFYVQVSRMYDVNGKTPEVRFVKFVSKMKG